MLDLCSICWATATHRDSQTGALLCAAHARLVVAGPGQRHTDRQTPPMALRDLSPADAVAVRAIALAFWGKTDNMLTFGRAYDLLAESGLGVFVSAPTGEELAGVLIWTIHQGRGLVVDLSVWPRYQGMGVASSLLAHLEERLRSQGIAQLCLSTTNDNLPALSFYFQRGFVLERALPGAVAQHHTASGEEGVGIAGIQVRDELQLVKQL